MEQMHSCTTCGNSSINTVIDFGLHPPSNRFVPQASIEEEQETYQIGLGYCSSCETIQLSHRMPLHAVKPRFTWLTYNEPELHLDSVASQLRQLPGIGKSSRTLGLTYKDQSTLDRLVRLGLRPGSCLSNEQFSIFQSPMVAASYQAKHQPVDLLVARHMIEHAADAVGFINEVKGLIAKDGYLIIELPDSEKVLGAGNHAFIWEEHISYFTEQSLSILAEKVGAKLVWFARYPYSYEDCLIAALQFSSDLPSTAKPAQTSTCNVDALLQRFNQQLAAGKLEWREILQNYRNQGSKVAVFGAGHLSAKWINFLGLSDLIECVIDDHSHKAGMYMPGSKLPILPSSALQERGIKICISTLNPESEQKVRLKLAKYFDEGGIFIPAFKIIERNL